MGICFPLSKIEKLKYKENEDIPTHRIDSIHLKSDDYINSLAVCCEDKWALAQDRCISLYTDFAYSSSWETVENIRSLCADSNYIVAGGKTIEVFSYQGKSQSKLIGHERPVSSICLQGNLLLSGSSDWSLRLWDVFSQQELNKNLINWNVVTSLKWLDNNVAVQTSEDLRLRLWDIRERKIMKSAVISVGDNFATCCDAKDFIIATGHKGFSGVGCEVKVWDFRKKEMIFDMKAHSQSVEGIKILGDRFISCGKDGKIVEFSMDEIFDVWNHPGEVPLIGMDLYKKGILTATVEPKVLFFNLGPLKNEF